MIIPDNMKRTKTTVTATKFLHIITTEEELEALPVGSVVLSEKFSVHGREGFLHVAFQRWADGLWHRAGRFGDTHPDNFLPAKVLHEGDAA